MYAIDEISLNNKQDCWSRMFIYLSKAILEICGRNGEGAVREAARRYGADRGKAYLARNKALGLNNNLAAIPGTCCDHIKGPRTRELIIAHTEETFLWEVHTCPMASLWNEMGEGKIGLLYCEECYRGLVNEYTCGKGQANLSKVLTGGHDNHCRFSLYFRPANLDESQIADCFNKEKNNGPAENSGDFSTEMNQNWIKMYYYLLESAKERFGSEGICAVTEGLRKLAEDLVPVLEDLAERARKGGGVSGAVDEEFMKENLPIHMDVEEDPLWNGYTANNAKKLMKINFTDRLLAGMKSV